MIKRYVDSLTSKLAIAAGVLLIVGLVHLWPKPFDQENPPPWFHKIEARQRTGPTLEHAIQSLALSKNVDPADQVEITPLD
jgi:hypothetical protein